jgi:PLP dependent protein
VTRITEQLDHLHRRVNSAARSADRDPDAIRILAVSKKQPIKALLEAHAAGLRDFGENYLHEALDKMAALDAEIVWHFIGPVQSNKTRLIAENFDWVHTVSSHRVARRLSAQRPAGRTELQICIQLRPRGAEDRHGMNEDEIPSLAATITELPNLRLRGLMVIPLPDHQTADEYNEFYRTRRVFDDLNQSGYGVDTLSMGMSGDLEAAIMAGSTCVRIGTDLFGTRSI